MAKIEFKGLEEYRRKLSELSALSQERLLGAAIYDGAAIAADAIRTELEAVPTQNGRGTADKPKIGPSEIEKEGLKESLGVTPLRTDNGFVNVKIGFDGYNAKISPTPLYPRGKANQMIARSVESGTSFMLAHPFVKEALRKCRKQAKEAMGRRVEEEINKIMK